MMGRSLRDRGGHVWLHPKDDLPPLVPQLRPYDHELDDVDLELAYSVVLGYADGSETLAVRQASQVVRRSLGGAR